MQIYRSCNSLKKIWIWLYRGCSPSSGSVVTSYASNSCPDCCACYSPIM